MAEKYMTDKEIGDHYRSEAAKKLGARRAKTLRLLLVILGRLAWSYKRSRIRFGAFYDEAVERIADIMVRLRIDELLVSRMVLLMLEWKMKSYKEEEALEALERLVRVFGRRKTWELIRVEIKCTDSFGWTYQIGGPAKEADPKFVGFSILAEDKAAGAMIDEAYKAFGGKEGIKRFVSVEDIDDEAKAEVSLRVDRKAYTSLSAVDRRRLHRALELVPVLSVRPKTDRFMAGQKRKGW